MLREDVWAQIDHVYVDAKLGLVLNNISYLKEDAEQQLKQMNVNPTYDTVLGIVTRELEEWPELVYEVHKEVWQAQGKQITAEFIRVVYREAIVPEIQKKLLHCVRLATQTVQSLRVQNP